MVAFALRLNPNSSAECSKILALLHQPKSPVCTQNCSILNSSLRILLTPRYFLWVFAHIVFLLLPFTTLSTCGILPILYPVPALALHWGTYPASAQDEIPLWALKTVLCPSQPPIRSCVLSPKAMPRTLGIFITSPPIFFKLPHPNPLK